MTDADGDEGHSLSLCASKLPYNEIEAIVHGTIMVPVTLTDMFEIFMVIRLDLVYID